MLKKLVVASATVAAAAGLGLATPAYANGPVDVACVSPTSASRTTYSSSGLAFLGGSVSTTS